MALATFAAGVKTCGEHKSITFTITVTFDIASEEYLTLDKKEETLKLLVIVTDPLAGL